MKARFEAGRFACMVGAGLAVAVIVWTEKSLWRRAEEVHAQAGAVTSDRFHLSERLEIKLRSLDELVSRAVLDPAAPARARLAEEMAATRRWLASSTDLLPNSANGI